MWLTILSSVFSFLGGPVAKALVDGYQAKLAAGNTSERIAADLAGQEVASETAEMQARYQLKRDEIGHPWEPEKLAFYVTLAFYTKCLVYDKMLGWGSTDALGGDISIWAGLIMSFYFGQRTFQ